MKKALFWIGVYLALVLTPMFVLLVGQRPPPGGFWWDLGIALGFAGLAMMGVQFVLTARLRRATAPFGIDLIYYFHRYAAIVAFVIIVAHPLILLVKDPVLLSSFNPREAPWAMTAGVWSVFALVVVMFTSLFRKRIGLHYDAWRYLHSGLSVAAVLLALLHVEGIGIYVSDPWKRGVWGLMTITWVAILGYIRLVKPWRLLRRPYRVESVTKERGDAWTLAFQPDGHDGLSFEPGQFVWLSLRSSPFSMREHPFSISSSPKQPGGRVELTIKELGDFTRTIGATKPGEVAYLDGPHGAFTIDRVPSPSGYVFLAGGIGIAPLLSMIGALADRADEREHLLFYAYRIEERLTARERIDALATRLRLKVVYVLEESHEGWTGERGRIDAPLLDRHLPADRKDRQYFVCGPEPMTQAVEGALSKLDIPVTRVHSELFDLV